MKSIFEQQSNTIDGAVSILVGATTLVGKEGLLCVLGSAGLVPVAAKSDLALYLILEGAAPGALATVWPITADGQVRIKAKGTGSKGDTLVLATGADVGKVSTFAAQTDRNFSPGIAEENYVDGQLVLVRPLASYVYGATAAVSAAPAVTAATNTTPYGYTTAAQADAIRACVIEMRAVLISKGFMV